MEILVILALIFIMRLLFYRATSPRQIDVHHHHHFHLAPRPDERVRRDGEVVPFKPKIVK